MAFSFHLANTHRWLYEQLTESAELEPGTVLAESKREADVIIYLSPPWPDPGAPEPIRSFRPRDLARCFVYSQHDQPFAWAPGMYASLPASRARRGMTGGFYVAPNHRGEDMLSDGLEVARETDPDLLWSFVGTLSNAPVRQRLAELYDRDALVQDTQRFSDDIRWRPTGDPERRAAHADYAQIIGRSLFVVCPRGRGPGSMRLFEAMQAGRCPVIVSDDWLEPPFVDWSTCSVRVAEANLAELPAVLRARRGEAAALAQAGRIAWEELFSPRRQLSTLARGAYAAARSDRGPLVADVAAAARHSGIVRPARWMLRRALVP